MSQRVAIAMVDGFTDSGLSIALDVLRTANALVRDSGNSSTRSAAKGTAKGAVTSATRSDPFAISLVSPAGGPVRAASGIAVDTKAMGRLRPSIVLVPGYWLQGAGDLATLLDRDDTRKLVEALAKAHARGALIASACAGAFLLGDAGLLDGKRATTTWWLADALKERRPAIDVLAEAAMVVGKQVITGGAVFAQADVVLHLVGRFCGPSVARRCARLLLLDAHPSQAPYMAAQHVRSGDPTVEAAERWVRQRLAEDFDVELLADQLGVSPRTLARRMHAAVGLSPVGFVQRVRVGAAVHLLETSALSLAEIAPRVGYADASTLSRLIRRETGTSAREFRRRRQG